MSKWQFVELSKLCDLEKGKTGLMKAKEGQYPLVATGKDRRTCDTYQFDTKAVCIPLVSSTGHGHASLKYVHYQEGKFALGTILVAVIPKDENVLNAQFLHLYLSRLKDTILVPLMTGAANVTLTVTKLKTIKIPLPPIEEQLRIVSLFNSMDKEQSELITEIEYQQTLLKKLRQSILQEAIDGKLTTTWRKENPDVESASILLEKIKAEKEQLIKEKKIKKQKPLPSISEDEIPFDIPDSWVWCRLGCRLGETTSKITDGEHQTPPRISQGKMLLSAKNIRDGYIDFDNVEYISEADYEKSIKRCHPKQNDILIVSVGGTIGRSSILKKNIDFALVRSVALIQMIEVNTEYMKTIFDSSIFQKDIQKKSWGSAQPCLYLNKINILSIPLPPLKEQLEIVKRVKKLFKICDELETQINSAKTNSQTLIQAVLKEAFEK